jgi:hypothetical protein
MRSIRPFDACIVLFISLYSLFPSYLGMRVAGVLFNAPRAMTIGMIALILIDIAANKRTVPRLTQVFKRSSTPLLFVVGYLGFRFASAFASDDAGISFNAATSEFIYSTVFLFIGLYFVRSLEQFDRLIVVIVVACGIICVIGLVEASMQRNLVAAAFPMMEVTDEDYLKIALSEKLRGTYRVQSTFYHPLAFASYLILMMPLGIYCFRRAKRSVAKVSFFIVVMLMGVNAYFTSSRAALLAMVAIALFYWTKFSLGMLNQRPYVKRAIGITNICLIVAVAVCTVPAAEHLVKGKSQDEQSSSSGRLVQLQRGGEVVAEHPVFGVGPRMAGKYAGISDSFGETVDNWYLSLAVESGVGALVCFVGILTSIVLMAKRLASSHPGSEKVVYLCQSIEVSTIVFGVFLVILSLHDETFPYLFLLMGGLMSMRDLSFQARRQAASTASVSAPRMAVARSRL